MCVVAIAWDSHPKWKLVLAGNRDEFHARPSAAIARWQEHPHLIAGRDLQSGGTWLGVSEEGRLAVVTNLRGFGDPQADKASRGQLLADWLSGKGAYAGLGLDQLNYFNPFNLFVADRNEASFLTNRPTARCEGLASGLHSLSNGTQDQPWPRREALADALGEWLAGEADDPQLLLDELAVEWWRDGVPSADAEGEPTPIFMRAPGYGTRCSTVVLIDRLGAGQIIERRFGEEGLNPQDECLTFQW